MTTELDRIRDRLRATEDERDRYVSEGHALKGVREELQRERDEKMRIDKERQWVEVQIRTKETEIEESKRTVQTLQRAM